MSLLQSSLWVVERAGEPMIEGADGSQQTERPGGRIRIEARGRIRCVDAKGGRHFVNKFAHVVVNGGIESDGETLYRLDDGAAVAFVSDGVYRIIETGAELRPVRASG